MLAVRLFLPRVGSVLWVVHCERSSVGRAGGFLIGSKEREIYLVFLAALGRGVCQPLNLDMFEGDRQGPHLNFTLVDSCRIEVITTRSLLL